MTPFVLGALLAAAQAGYTPKSVDQLVADIARSGRVLVIAERSDERLRPPYRLAPGQPPVFAFRNIEGVRKHRFGNLNLVMDDAGH